MADIPETPPQQTTPTQAAEAAAAKLIAEQDATRKAAYESSLDIRDPGQVYEQLGPSATSSVATPEKPKTLAGSSADGGYTEALLQRASSLDIPQAEAKQIPPDVLRRHLDRLEQARPAPQQYQPQEPEVFYTPEGHPFTYDERGQAYYLQPETPQLPSLRDWKGPEGEVMEPALIEAIEARDAFYQQQLAERDQVLQQVQQTLQAQQQQSQVRQDQEDWKALSACFAADKDMAETFGEGNPARGTSAFEARKEVAFLMDDMRNGYWRRGQNPPDAQTLYDRAKMALYGQKATTNAQQQIADRARDAAGRFIGRTTATTRSEGWEGLPKGEQRAYGAVADYLRNGNRG